MKRKIRMGMVGSAPGAFIGGVHRIAARLDGKIELVCGAFDIDPANAMLNFRRISLRGHMNVSSQEK